MNHWWRAYNEAVNDPKLQLLSDALFRVWFNLMCIASANGGGLPAIASLAFTLRVKPEVAAKYLAQLHAAGLLDKTETGFVPHNWNGRQYKSDVSTERVQRFRNKKRNVSSSVSETPPETENRAEDGIGDARARGRSMFTEASKALATAFLQALSIEPKAPPPELAGVDWRAVSWETAGWTLDLIDAETRRVGPGKPITYYEKCFATAFAKRQQPLPKVEISTQETVHVSARSERRRTVHDAASDLHARIAALDEPAPSGIRDGTSEGAVRLLSSR